MTEKRKGRCNCCKAKLLAQRQKEYVKSYERIKKNSIKLCTVLNAFTLSITINNYLWVEHVTATKAY